MQRIACDKKKEYIMQEVHERLQHKKHVPSRLDVKLTSQTVSKAESILVATATFKMVAKLLCCLLEATGS